MGVHLGFAFKTEVKLNWGKGEKQTLADQY